MTDFEFEPPADEWDDDVPWLVQVDDDQMAVRPPFDAIEVLTDGVLRFARELHPALSLQIDDDGTPRALELDELQQVVDSCADTLAFGLRHGLVTDETLEVLAEATGTLHTIAQFDLELRFTVGEVDAVARVRWVDALGRLATNCATMLFARFRPRRDGSFTIRWRPADRELIREGAAELRRLLSTDDPAIERLFPPAYEDAERNAGWDVFVRSELIEKRAAALDTVDALMATNRASADELTALMTTINDARLVFGTQLRIDADGPADDLTDGERRLVMVYELLGAILHDLILAMRTTL